MASAADTSDVPVRVMRAEEIVPRGVLPTGHDTFDHALGIGGLPSGRLITYHGHPACGKTTRALEDIVNVQRRGGVGVYEDFESKLDLNYAAALGVDMEAFIYLTPRWIEEGMELTEQMIGVLREEDPDMPVVFVWDSASAAKCKASMEAKDGYEDFNMSREARVYANHMPRFCRVIQQTNAILIGIAQRRDKIEMKGPFSVKKEKIGPGNAWGHHTSLVLSWIKGTVIRGKVKGAKGKKVLTGTELSRIQVVKNQAGGEPWREFELLLRYGTGYDQAWSTFQAALNAGLITKSGAWYSIDDYRLGQGVDNCVEELRKDQDVLDELRIPLRAGFDLPIVGWDEPIDEDDK